MRRALGLLLALGAGCAAPARGTHEALAPPRIELAIGSGELALPHERLQRWLDETVALVAAGFGRFPVPELRLRLVPRPGSRGIHDGRTTPGTPPQVEIGLGSRAGERALARDWVLVHELVHLAIPNLPADEHWFEEGLATYLEPFLRARAGRIGEEDVWRELVRDYAQGLPRAGEGGLDDTHTWARTYYGGALFCLVADVEIARASGGTKSLLDGLRGTLARGHSIREDAELAGFARELDAELGLAVLAPLAARWAHAPVAPDLAALWRELGVAREGERIRFDAAAPLADWRARLVRPGAPGASSSARAAE